MSTADEGARGAQADEGARAQGAQGAQTYEFTAPCPADYERMLADERHRPR